MCYEFEREYRQRAEEARKAMQEAEERKQQSKTPVPAKETGKQQPEPVPV